MNNIIITGATSMIGVALMNIAIREKTNIYAIIRRNTNRINRIPNSPYVHVVYAELDEISKINSIPEACDCFYHFGWAGTKKVDRDDPRIQEKNIGYTLDAVELAKRLNCLRFVGAGSQAEYGFTDCLINENTQCNPTTSYGIAKYAAGILSRKRCEQLDLEHIWGRIFSVSGPHDNEGTLLLSAIDHFIAGEISRFSAATQIWNYLFESDAGEFFYRLGLSNVIPGTYLVANHESH